MIEDRWAHSPYPKTCRLMEGLGIDPHYVSADHPPTLEHYHAIVSDPATGKKMVKPDGELMVEIVPWPSAAAGRVIYESYQSELHVALRDRKEGISYRVEPCEDILKIIEVDGASERIVLEVYDDLAANLAVELMKAVRVPEDHR